MILEWSGGDDDDDPKPFLGRENVFDSPLGIYIYQRESPLTVGTGVTITV